jgi:hypothetical protein
MVFIEIIIGGLIALAVLYAFRNLKDHQYRKFFARTLIIAALIYVGFAIIGIWFDTAGYNWLLVETAGVFIYTLLAYWGLQKSVWFLSIGWLAHVLWDVGLHFGDGVAFVPWFYPTVCIGFDIVFGVYIAYKFYNRD